MKRISSILVAVLILFFTTNSIVVPARCEDSTSKEKKYFIDIAEDYWAKDSIKKAFDNGLINGYPDGTFRPEGLVTRAEFVTMINRLMKYPDTGEKANFTDVKDTDWYYKNLAIAQVKGYINGYPDGTSSLMVT